MTDEPEFDGFDADSDDWHEDDSDGGDIELVGAFEEVSADPNDSDLATYNPRSPAARFDRIRQCSIAAHVHQERGDRFTEIDDCALIVLEELGGIGTATVDETHELRRLLALTSIEFRLEQARRAFTLQAAMTAGHPRLAGSGSLLHGLHALVALEKEDLGAVAPRLTQACELIQHSEYFPRTGAVVLAATHRALKHPRVRDIFDTAQLDRLLELQDDISWPDEVAFQRANITVEVASLACDNNPARAHALARLVIRHYKGLALPSHRDHARAAGAWRIVEKSWELRGNSAKANRARERGMAMRALCTSDTPHAEEATTTT